MIIPPRRVRAPGAAEGTGSGGAGTEGTQSKGVEPDPGSVETLARRARWLAAPLVLLQFSLYVAPPGTHLPFSRWWGLLPAAMLVAVNVESLRRHRAGTSGSPRWTLFQLVADGAVISLLIGMFTFDVTSALWTLVLIPVLEAATRGWSRRALVTFVVLAVAYVGREAVADLVFDRRGATFDAVTYRVGFLAIMAIATAGLGGRLSRQIADTAAAQAEADQLRDLAVATRRMSSLDVPTVVREVTRAARTFGFSGVQLRSRSGAVLGHDPGGGWQPSVHWFDATAEAAAETGHVVLAGADAGMPLDDDEVLVAAAVTAGDTVEALLVGRHRTPLRRRDVECLTLLGAQASAVLANALRYEEGRAFEERLAHQATHDALTGLPNRALLHDRARAAIARSRRNELLVAVMFIDLDRFKEINDVLGHTAGDALLQQVARRIVDRVRPEDTCARVGGDEFVVVAGDHADPVSVVELARRVLAALHEPFQVGADKVDIEASLGLAWAPTHGDDVEVLLRRADVAMYAAKSRREGVVVYHEADDRLTPVHLSTLGDLRRALETGGQLATHFQPIVEVAGAAQTGRLVAAEALLRWNHPERGVVHPDDFIPIAEGTSMIHQVTEHVLELALGALRDLDAQGLPVDLAVNLSTRTLLDASFSRRLAALLDRSGVEPRRLRLEITESALLGDPTRAIATMHRLRDLGVRLSIDDFGTGYSSMSYLKSLPVDEIKIDRTFVTDMVGSVRDGAVVHSVVDLAHSLGLRVVAEGVEDDQTLDALAWLGCDLAQGFHIGRPMPPAELAGWLDRRVEARRPLPTQR